MESISRGIRVQVFFGESDQVGRTPRYQALLEYLRREGAAGATVTRGVAGFGAASRIHTASILRLSADLPMVLTWIDTPRRVDRLLPGVRALAGSGVITVEDVGIAAYGRRRADQLRFDLSVRDAMTAPAQSVGEGAPVRDAVTALLGRRYRALPVVDAANRVVGMIANSDLVERAGLTARLELLAAMPESDREAALAALRDVTVGSVMTAAAVVAQAGETVAAAARRMSEARVKRLPVLDPDGTLAGVLSRGDILRAVAEAFPGPTADGAVAVAPDRTGPASPPERPGPDQRTAAAPPAAPAATASAPGTVHLAGRVGDLVRADGPTIAADAPLSDVLTAVVSTPLNRAVVLDADRRVLGVVTERDVLESAEPEGRGAVVGALMGGGGAAGGDRTAAQLISTPSITLTPDATLADAVHTITAHRRALLPVVDADGRFLGIVDRDDLLRASRDILERAMAERADDDDD